MIHYKNTDQISEPDVYEYVQPKYAKSTTDPTYYEPAATRIANMRKASGVILEGIYDFYTKDDVEKFNEKNFEKNIAKANPDFKFVKGLTQEEVSQVTTNYEEKVDSMLQEKENKKNKSNERIQENVATSKIIQSQTKTENTTDTE